MIQANELRIGNYIKSPPMTIPRLQISSDGIMQITGYGISVLESDTTGKLGWEPIELTEEWLIKLGFDMVKVNKTTCICIDMQDKSQQFTCPIVNNIVCLSIWIEDGFLYLGTRIIYVHQLQNLFFSLTGDELTIKQ